MSTPTGPNWYDLLDVDHDAADTEIRAAWKAAIADLDPTDRRFRVYNQAAEVLLDPATRTAYDAELAAAQPAEEPEPTPPASDETGAPPEPRPADDGPTARRWVPAGWLLAGLAVLTALMVAALVYFWTQPSDTSVEESTRAAQSAAERAVVPVLSYDASTLEDDQAEARTFLTSDYRSEYDKLFEVIKQNAPSTGTKVEAEVVASGIVRSGSESDRVEILLFVNRPTTNKAQSQPVVYKDQVTLTMENVDGDWLVDDMVTSPVAP